MFYRFSSVKCATSGILSVKFAQAKLSRRYLQKSTNHDSPELVIIGNKILFFKNILTFYQILILNGSYYRYYVAKCKYVNSLMKS